MTPAEHIDDVRRKLQEERDLRIKENRESDKELLNERNERYKERETANKEAVKTANEASDKLAEEIKSSLKEYKAGSNEWRSTVETLISKMKQQQPPVWMKVAVITVAIALFGFVVTVALFLLK